jgi:hypothetical protein
MYKITDYSYEKAKKLNVQIKPSTKKNKKIDVFKNGKLISTIGDINYLDYPNYIKKAGLTYANERRRLYRIRHKNDISIVGSNGWFSNKILW